LEQTRSTDASFSAPQPLDEDLVPSGPLAVHADGNPVLISTPTNAAPVNLGVRILLKISGLPFWREFLNSGSAGSPRGAHFLPLKPASGPDAARRFSEGALAISRK
jgi:hypothetical protein